MCLPALVSHLTALQRGWLRRITGKPYRARVIHSKPIGGRLGLETGNPELHAINLEAALAYVLKGQALRRGAQFGLERLEPGGRVHRQALRHVAKHRRKGAKGRADNGEKDKAGGRHEAKQCPGGTASGSETGAQAIRAEAAGASGEARAGHACGLCRERLAVRPKRRRIMDFVDHMQCATAKAQDGDLAIASRLLASQAMSLDSMFTELARRSATTWAIIPTLPNSYMRLAFKAQGDCRSTLEALAKLHQPREQTVNHVHVNQGGQAVVADQFHHHAGATENGKTAKQSDATDTAGASATLPGPDTGGDGVPVPGGETASGDAGCTGGLIRCA